MFLMLLLCQIVHEHGVCELKMDVTLSAGTAFRPRNTLAVTEPGGEPQDVLRTELPVIDPSVRPFVKLRTGDLADSCDLHAEQFVAACQVLGTNNQIATQPLMLQ